MARRCFLVRRKAPSVEAGVRCFVQIARLALICFAVSVVLRLLLSYKARNFELEFLSERGTLSRPQSHPA